MSAHYVKDPVLDDLMNWHLYIGYCRKDREPVKCLLSLIETYRLKCFLRSSLDVEESSQSDNIKQGITFSHKCLLYISQNYLRDPWSKQELKEAKRKWKFLGKNSVFVIIQSDVDKEQLERYKQFEQINIQDNQTIQSILMNHPILSDYELKPQLNLVPKQNIGVGVAYTYFFGFLQVVVPDIRKKFEEEMKHQSIEKKLLVKKMLIIIRKTVKSPPKLAEKGVLEQTKFTVRQCADRSGREKREYTVPIYKLTADVDDVYYFVGDLPACLYAIREAFDRNLTNMSLDEVYEARNEFVLTLKALLSHPENQSSFANQWEMLVWPDEDPNLKLSQFLYQQITSKCLTEVNDVSIPKAVDRGTFRVTEGICNYPMYREGHHYSLDRPVRGICVIISNSSFSNLPPRTAAKAEIEKLTLLFEKLKFKVEVHQNLNGQQMMDCFKEYQGRDHSESDAFVCCLLSHGNKGSISASDGHAVPIMNLMELIFERNCPGLKNKPKLFFIGACQGEGADAGTVPSSSGEPLSHDASPGSEAPPLHKAGPRSSAETVRDLVPPTVDFIVSYSTLPDTVAWAHPEMGGLYVDALRRHLVRDLEIDVALRYVNQEVKKHLDGYDSEGEKYSRQDPFHIIMPPHKFLFLGGSQNHEP